MIKVQTCQIMSQLHSLSDIVQTCFYPKIICRLSLPLLVSGFLLIWPFMKLLTWWCSLLRKKRRVCAFGVYIFLKLKIIPSICKTKGNNDGWSSWRKISNIIFLNIVLLGRRIFVVSEHTVHISIQERLVRHSYNYYFYYLFLQRAARSLIQSLWKASLWWSFLIMVYCSSRWKLDKLIGSSAREHSACAFLNLLSPHTKWQNNKTTGSHCCYILVVKTKI